MFNGQSMKAAFYLFYLFNFFVQDFLTGRDIPMMNENAIANILIDVDFLEDELKRIGRSHLATAFIELRLVSYSDLEIVSNGDNYYYRQRPSHWVVLFQSILYLLPGVRHMQL